jgi:hypothetical protein
MNTTELVTSFYEGFKNLNHEKMKEAYHPDAVFSDPVFLNLNYNDTNKMWKMLCLKAKDFHLRFKIVEISDSKAVVRWEADYLFSKTNRQVKNIVTAEIFFKDGKIIRHRDDFDFWRWSAMALGPIGLIMGWTPFLKKKVQAQAMDQLSHS